MTNGLNETALIVSANSNEDAVNTSPVPVELDDAVLVESEVGQPTGETNLDETLQASNLDETVELTVNVSPLRRVLRSHRAKQNVVKSTSKKGKIKKRGKKSVSKKKTAIPVTPAIASESPHTGRHRVPSTGRKTNVVQKRSIRGDGVDERCRVLKVKYKKYEGDVSPKSRLHFSQFKYNTKNMIPNIQQVPGECVLCPQQKLLISDRDKITHYNAVHISKLIIVGNTTSL